MSVWPPIVVQVVIMARLAGHVLGWIERRHFRPWQPGFLADVTVLIALTAAGFFHPIGIA